MFFLSMHPNLTSFFFSCLFLRERQRGSRGGTEREGEREREGDTESEAGFRLGAVSIKPDTGLKLTNREIMI